MLVTAERLVVGCVEDVFGPVASPLYALRYAGPRGEPMPEAVAAGGKLFSVDRWVGPWHRAWLKVCG